ncbi:cell fusion protein aff-1-like [Branchiostoma floridae x Branchiostoma japonicum]
MVVLRAVLLWASISGIHGNRCTKTLPTTGHVRYSSRESAQALVETFIQSSIKPGETLCFTLHDVTNDDATSDVSISMATNGSVPLLWQLTYEGIEMEYGVKNRYSFYRPKYESKCICDCPQYGDYCNSKTNRCTDHDLDFCYNTYISDQTAHGCLAYWNSEESEVCCALYVGKHPESPKYDAVYLSSDGKPIVKLALKVYDSRTDEVVYSYPTFTVALNDRTHRAQHSVRMEVTGDTPTQIDSGYYYATSEGTQLYTDVSINGLNEFDPRKMGWLKVRDDGTVERPPERTVLDGFHLKTHKCHNKFDYTETWQIYGEENWKHYSGSRVENFYGWVRRVSYYPQRRSVTVVPRYDRLVTVKIGINTTTNVLFFYHDSDLIDFEAEVRVDRHSNRFANITLVAAVGSLVGSITPYYGADGASSATVHRFELHVDSPPAANTIKRISLPKTINGTSRMCLSPLSKPNNEVCKTVPFLQEALQDFFVPPTWRPGNPGSAGPGFNFNWLFDFFGFLNPAEWFDGIQGWLELFAMLLDIALFSAAIFLFIKVCTCFNVAGLFTTKVPKWGEGVEMSVLPRRKAEPGDVC